MATDRLPLAIAAIKRGDRAVARQLLQAIYPQLLAVKPWEKAAISGREILDVHIYAAQGKDSGSWTDTGCNSLVVQSVEITP